MTTENNQKEMTPKNLNDLGNGLDVAVKVVHFFYYYELVEKNYIKIEKSQSFFLNHHNPQCNQKFCYCDEHWHPLF